MKRALLAAALLALGMAVAQAQTASVPQLVNYQGRLADIDGVPLETGNYALEFNIYAVKTGGTPIWGPLQFDNGAGNGHGAKVPVVNGHFNVFLGPVDINNRPVSVAFANPTTYLGIKVTTGTSFVGVPELSPRQQILSSPYALQAGDADTLGKGKVAVGAGSALGQIVVNTRTSIGSGYAATGAPTDGLIVQGNVGIGANNPGANKLQVGGPTRVDGTVANQGLSVGGGYMATAPPAGGAIIEGSVGIGTPNPGTNKLQIIGNMRADGIVATIRNAIGSGYITTAPPADGLIVQGSVGVGTNDPAGYKMRVMGAARMDGAVYGQSASLGSGYIGIAPPGSGLIVEGNVGIGVSGPAEKLEVAGRIKDKTGYVMPVGAVVPYAGNNAPTGWLVCDGSAVSRTALADLFSAIGTTYGAGNGSTTFNLPNLKGRFPVGVDSGQGEFNWLGKTGGEKYHTLTIAEMPSHTHDWLHGWEQDDSGYGGSYNEFTWAGGSFAGSQVMRATGGNGAHNTLPPYLTMNYIIKY